MTLSIPAKVLLHVWSYDFYDMTLSTGKQRRHMIKSFFLVYSFGVLRTFIYNLHFKSSKSLKSLLTFKSSSLSAIVEEMLTVKFVGHILTLFKMNGGPMIHYLF